MGSRTSPRAAFQQAALVDLVELDADEFADARFLPCSARCSDLLFLAAAVRRRFFLNRHRLGSIALHETTNLFGRSQNAAWEGVLLRPIVELIAEGVQISAGFAPELILYPPHLFEDFIRGHG
jgi:hypothetical protein